MVVRKNRLAESHIIYTPYPPTHPQIMNNLVVLLIVTENSCHQYLGLRSKLPSFSTEAQSKYLEAIKIFMNKGKNNTEYSLSKGFKDFIISLQNTCQLWKADGDTWGLQRLVTQEQFLDIPKHFSSL